MEVLRSWLGRPRPAKWPVVRLCCRRLSVEGKKVGRAALSQLSQGRWRESPATFCFAEEAQVTVGSWSGVERSGTVEKAEKAKPCKVFQLASFLPLEDAKQVLNYVKASPAYEDYLDSVDHNPVFEFYAVADGQWKNEELRAFLDPFVQERLLPYVRERYSCGSCSLDQILIRRYVPGERRTLGVHYDVHAFVTCVLGLSDPSDYVGGLYLQPGAHASSQMFFRIEPGDVVVHSFDLEHGVFMWSGERYSMIFWLKDSPESVSANTSPWYDALVEAGDREAMYNVAQDAEMGIFGRAKDLQKALALYDRSAAMGHYCAQYRLGLLLYLGDGEAAAAQDVPRGVEWIRSAAEQGFAPAQKTYALVLASGVGLPQDFEQAAVWMRRAAEQLDHEAANHLGEFYLKGYGVPRDERAAARWYTVSADAGLPEAQYTLGTLYSKGLGVPTDFDQAVAWFSRAANQGSSKAKRRLTVLSKAGS